MSTKKIGAIIIALLSLGFIISFLIVMKNTKKTTFGIFTIKDSQTITMNGDIITKTPEHFEKLLKYYPDVNTIIFEECPGSEDDDAVFETGRLIRKNGFTTYLPSYGVIESGAVELFFAGEKRIVEKGAQIGVHTWKDDDTNKVATDFPKNHKEHKPYILYYTEMGIGQDFYFFTINASDYDNLYYLTEEEIEYFKLRTE